MKIQIKKASIVLLALAGVAFQQSAHAVPLSTISVNFGIDFLNSTDVAGASPFAQSNYNNVFNTSASSLVNNTGAATTASLSITGATASTYGTSNGPTTPDEVLNEAFFSHNGNWSFTLSNIPYANYSIVIYSLGAGSDPADVRSISVGGTTYYSTSPSALSPGYQDGNPATSFIYTQATSTNSAAPTTSSDYFVFSNLSGANQTVTINAVSGPFSETEIGGFQIVQTIPEPGTGALVGLGLAAIPGVLRFRRRIA